MVSKLLIIHIVYTTIEDLSFATVVDSQDKLNYISLQLNALIIKHHMPKSCLGSLPKANFLGGLTNGLMTVIHS